MCVNLISFRALYGLISIQLNMKYLQYKNISIIDLFDKTVERHPNKMALIKKKKKKWTFLEVNYIVTHYLGYYMLF